MQIPPTINEAKKALTKIDGIVTASEWERAAIVYAFTEVGDGWNSRRSSNARSTLTLTEFAELGIAGLVSRATVGRYRKAWADAVEAGEVQEAAPGKKVAIPKKEWAGSGKDKVQDIINNPAKVVEAVQRSPELASRVAKSLPPARIAERASEPDVARAIARNDAAADAVGDASIEHRARNRDPELAKRLERNVDEATNELAKQLGIDQATAALRHAAGLIGEAIVLKNLHGINHPDDEREAVENIRHALDLYTTGDENLLTDTDRDFLSSLGIDA